MEQCVKDHIVNHMIRNKLLSTQQFGFIKGRSTVLQLLNVIDSWTKALDRGGSIYVVYLVFMKEFDTVPHKRLIGKLMIQRFSKRLIVQMTSIHYRTI